jgi:hypothetical protein
MDASQLLDLEPSEAGQPAVGVEEPGSEFEHTFVTDPGAQEERDQLGIIQAVDPGAEGLFPWPIGFRTQVQRRRLGQQRGVACPGSRIPAR